MTFVDYGHPFIQAAERGEVDAVDYWLRNPLRSVWPLFARAAIIVAAARGHLAVVERLLQDERVDPSAEGNSAIRFASSSGYLEIVNMLLQDARVDPSAKENESIRHAAYHGRVGIVNRLLEEPRVEPAACQNDAIRSASVCGHLAIVKRLLQDTRVDPSACNNAAVREAAIGRHFMVVDRLLEDNRVDITVALAHSPLTTHKRFEYRTRLTAICIALQSLALPAWVTIQILKAALPHSTLRLYSKWNLVCAVKHFHEKRR